MRFVFEVGLFEFGTDLNGDLQLVGGVLWVVGDATDDLAPWDVLLGVQDDGVTDLSDKNH